jgi:hypothetical protein
MPVTGNEATLIGAFGSAALAAIVGGVVSLFVAKYTVKHSADYSEQISTINSALESLAATQEEMRQQHATSLEADDRRHKETERKEEATRWKPTGSLETRIESSQQVNELILKSSLSFVLKAVWLASPSGAKLYDYPVLSVASTGFRVPIPPPSLHEVAQLSPLWQSRETFEGLFYYIVARESDGIEYRGEIAFHGSRVMVGNNLCYKLTG